MCANKLIYRWVEDDWYGVSLGELEVNSATSKLEGTVGLILEISIDVRNNPSSDEVVRALHTIIKSIEDEGLPSLRQWRNA